MKKTIALLLSVLLLLSFAACSDSKDPAAPAGETGKEAAPGDAAALPTVLNQNEYVLYQNIFFQDQADDYVGKTAEKEGTYARLYDAFSQKYRYYVWGYMDATKCCDWQWEFVPADPESLPPVGSLIKMTGTLVRDEAALDKLWFVDTAVELEQRYAPADTEVDMTVMDSTLERVQLLNMQYKPDQFQGKSLRIYARVLNGNTIQHPYYDNAWTQEVAADELLPAIGTMVIIAGSWEDSAIRANSVEGTSAY